MLALTSLTRGGRSVGIVRSLTKATKFSFSELYQASLIFLSKKSHYFCKTLLYRKFGSRGRAVDRGTRLQAGKSQVRILMRLLDIFNFPNHSSNTVAQGLTESLLRILQEIERGRRLSLTILQTFIWLLSRKCGILDISQSYMPPQPVTGIALLSQRILWHGQD
jgi:hypothetical protein